MSSRRTHQVKEVARIARISVRTLHHYDAIGLLVPSARSDAGYRLYNEADLLRLQQILIGRELGLALEDIRHSLDDPEFDHRQALLQQRERLLQRALHTSEMIRAIDNALVVLDQKGTTDTMDIRDILGGFDPAKYEDEAKARWGDTDAYKTSAERTKRYGASDWKQLQEEQAAIYHDAASAMLAGELPDATGVMEIAERHRASIDRWFYPCGPSMHRALADMYEADPRFAANIDKFGPGLTPYLAAAIRANARRQTSP